MKFVAATCCLLLFLGAEAGRTASNSSDEITIGKNRIQDSELNEHIEKNGEVPWNAASVNTYPTDWWPSYGCYRDYCWANCAAFMQHPSPEWCYTTRGYSQDFKYVRCSRHYECDRHWKCAGSCTI